MLFVPNDLRSNAKSSRLKAGRNRRGMYPGVPNVRHVSRKKLERFSPIGLIVIRNGARLALIAQARTFAPLRIV